MDDESLGMSVEGFCIRLVRDVPIGRGVVGFCCVFQLTRAYIGLPKSSFLYAKRMLSILPDVCNSLPLHIASTYISTTGEALARHTRPADIRSHAIGLRSTEFSHSRPRISVYRIYHLQLNASGVDVLKDADASISPAADSPTLQKRLAGRDGVELHLNAPSSSTRVGDMAIEEAVSCDQESRCLEWRMRSAR